MYLTVPEHYCFLPEPGVKLKMFHLALPTKASNWVSQIWSTTYFCMACELRMIFMFNGLKKKGGGMGYFVT